MLSGCPRYFGNLLPSFTRDQEYLRFRHYFAADKNKFKKIKIKYWKLKIIFTFAHLTKGGDKIMLIIPIKDGENIDRALKRYKRKFDKTGTVRQLRARTAFIKPSVINRMKFQKAAYIQNMRDSIENI